MKGADAARIEAALRGVPDGAVEVVPGGAVSARADGRGRLEIWPVLEGIDAFYCAFSGAGAAFRHPPRPHAIAICHCRSGRVGWNLSDGTALYLGEGDLSVHGMEDCADSSMAFPLGYAEGIAFAVDLERLEANCPEILREAGFRPLALRERLLADGPAALPASAAIEAVFAPAYAAPPALRAPWLKLKAQELLLDLDQYSPEAGAPARVCARQTERIREAHELLTAHPERRWTIEELSKRCLINSCALKEGFKAVYGAPIATYMKEYRIRLAMRLLRETDDSVAAVAAQVGYGSQGKFAQAFRDAVWMLPTEYRRRCRGGKR